MINEGDDLTRGSIKVEGGWMPARVFNRADKKLRTDHNGEKSQPLPNSLSIHLTIINNNQLIIVII